MQEPKPKIQESFKIQIFFKSTNKRVSQFSQFSDTIFDLKYPVHAVPGPIRGDRQIGNRQTDITSYRLNRPRGHISENVYAMDGDLFWLIAYNPLSPVLQSQEDYSVRRGGQEPQQ